MIVTNSLLHDAVIFGLTAAAGLGQLLDCRTTEVGLANGDTEGNPIGRWLIAKVGITGAYAIKVGALPIIGAIVYGAVGFTYGVILPALFAAAGFTVGIKNYLLLRKQGKQVF